MRLPPFLFAALLAAVALPAGAQTATGRVTTAAPGLSTLQGDWPAGGGSVVTIAGTSGRLTKVSAEDRAAGYAKDDLLVQGLAYLKSVTLNSGETRASFSGTCRSPIARKGKVDWVVSDCELQLVLPSRPGAELRLATLNGSPLIAGRRAGTGGQTIAAAPPPPPAPAAAPPADPNDTWSRRTMDPAELAAQDAGTARANAAIKARNDAAAARERKSLADYRAAKAAREAEIAANKAAYDKEMAAYQARVAANEAANAKAKAEWEAAVQACRAGDKSKCATK